MIPNLAIFSQYFLGKYQFTSCLSTIEGTCLPQPEAALFPFESPGAADMSYTSARATNPLPDNRLRSIRNLCANSCEGNDLRSLDVLKVIIFRDSMHACLTVCNTKIATQNKGQDICL